MRRKKRSQAISEAAVAHARVVADFADRMEDIKRPRLGFSADHFALVSAEISRTPAIIPAL